MFEAITLACPDTEVTVVAVNSDAAGISETRIMSDAMATPMIDRPSSKAKRRLNSRNASTLAPSPNNVCRHFKWSSLLILILKSR